MKIQNLAIIFLVIAIPLIMVLSYYLNLQQQTLRLQIEYDTKLAQATKEGIKAFESNTIDWSEYIKDLAGISERSTALASVNTFLTSLENNLNLSGTAREYMSNYIPAVAITLYDGYYVYSSNYVCIAIQNKNGIQLYYNEATDKIEDEYTGENIIIYEPVNTNVATKTKQYTYIDDFGEEVKEDITFVIDREDAKKEYKPVLNNKNNYNARYTKNNTNVIVNYTLDNKIYVYGVANDKKVATSAYLVYFNEDTQMPRISSNKVTPQKIEDILLNETINVIYNGVGIRPELLEEQILYQEDNKYKLGTFPYIYDNQHEKLYWDEEVNGGKGALSVYRKGNFFTIDPVNKTRKYLDTSNEIRAGSEKCKYKTVSVLWGTTNGTAKYKKLYMALNGYDKGKWFMNIKDEPDNWSGEESADAIDTQVSWELLTQLGLVSQVPGANTYVHDIKLDYSAINYYVESYAFGNWVKENLIGVKQQIYNETTKKYEAVPITVEGARVDIFDISETNNPEEDYSPIVTHKKELMKESVTSNLNLAISNYSRGTRKI